MDIHELTIFLAVVDSGSITEAGKRLGTVQSNVTTRIKSLEVDLDTKLFHRRSRGMIPTAAGRELAGYARRIIGLARQAETAVRGSHGTSPRITVGSMETTAAVHLPAPLAAFAAGYPEAELTLVTAPTAELVAMVLDFELDGAFAAGPINHPELSSVPAFSERLVAVRAPGELHGAARHTMIGFRRGCAYRARMERWAAESGDAPVRILEFGSLDAILACAAAGMGTAVLPESTVQHAASRHKLAVAELPDGIAVVDTLFITRSDAPPSAALSAFVEMAASHEHAREL